MTDLIVLGALVVGLVEVIKISLKGKHSRFYPLIAVILGLSLSVGLGYQYIPIQELVANGIIIGLSAVGLYAGTRSTFTVEK